MAEMAKQLHSSRQKKTIWPFFQIRPKNQWFFAAAAAAAVRANTLVFLLKAKKNFAKWWDESRIIFTKESETEFHFAILLTILGPIINFLIIAAGNFWLCEQTNLKRLPEVRCQGMNCRVKKLHVSMVFFTLRNILAKKTTVSMPNQ